MNRAVIGLGSNIEAHINIEKARQFLNKKFEVIQESTLKTTKPIGYSKQNDFINGAVLLNTELEQKVVKRELRGIESKMGRKKNFAKYGPRIIDLDIIIWNEKIIDQDFYERDFIKKSVLELLPKLKY